MPELPEVETTRRALQSLIGCTFNKVIVRNHNLRYPVPALLAAELIGDSLLGVSRRAKYLLLNCGRGTVIVHLGMSGSLRIIAASSDSEKHDHVDFCFDNGSCLRLRDPRRFGSVLWTAGDPFSHPLLKNLGPEPFDLIFTGDYLYEIAKRRSVPVKQLIMDSRVVVGVGNIYASEALFLAKIDPRAKANAIAKDRYSRLVGAIIDVLSNAIDCGGTTLRDFYYNEGQAGYFQRQLSVYGKAGELCVRCQKGRITECRLGQRSTFFCSSCQR